MIALELATGRARRLALVADDDDDIRHSLADILEGEGFVVLEARDGREALELAAHHAPDLILLDQRMPFLTGAEVFAALEARSLGGRVVLMTADTQVAAIARRAGIAHYIAKPFAVDALLALIGRALCT